MENERNQCRKCGGNAIPSKALMNYHYIDKSYHRGEKEFETKLLDCLKCSSCGHSWVPIKSTTEIALEWWNSLISDGLRAGYAQKHLNAGFKYKSLTGREIEEIWRKETQIFLGKDGCKFDGNLVIKKMNNDCSNCQILGGQCDCNLYMTKPNQKQFDDTLCDNCGGYGEECDCGNLQLNHKNYHKYNKVNQKQLNVTNCGNKNCQNGVINGVTPRICKKCNPSNAKQFKHFNPELFKAYIDKFSDEDKIKCIELMLNTLSSEEYINFINNYEDKL